MAGVTVAFEELESDVAATAAVAASRRTNTRNNFFGIHSVLSFEHRNCSSGTIKSAAKNLPCQQRIPVLKQGIPTSTAI
jgi:hypothetical protein